MSDEAAQIILNFENRVVQALRRETSAELRFLGQLPRLVRKISSLLHLTETSRV